MTKKKYLYNLPNVVDIYIRKVPVVNKQNSIQVYSISPHYRLTFIYSYFVTHMVTNPNSFSQDSHKFPFNNS